MNRKILKKIKLINWHYFENEEIEVQDSALFFGDNGFVFRRQRIGKIYCFRCVAICLDCGRKVLQ